MVHSQHNWLKERIPSPVWISLTPEQRAAIVGAAIAQSTEVLVDYRVSVRWRSKGYFIRVLVGNERRSLARLRQEGQFNLSSLLFLISITVWCAVTSALVIIATLAYLWKSYVGIDLTDGNSFLHQFFFN